MAIIDTIKAKARARVMHIVLPEGEETRNVHAASIIQKEGLARLTLLGDAEKIKAAYPDVCLCGVEIVNPATSEKAPEYAAKLYELRKAKGMTEEKARPNWSRIPMYLSACMMVKMRRRGRPGLRRHPFHGRYAAPGAADHQDQAGHEVRFFLLRHGVPDKPRP